MKLEDLVKEATKSLDIKLDKKPRKVSIRELRNLLSKYRDIEHAFWYELAMPNNRYYYFEQQDTDPRFKYIGIILRNFYFDLIIVMKTYLEKLVWWTSIKRAKNKKSL